MVLSWDTLRLCPVCGFHKYRLNENAEEQVQMTCDGCGQSRRVPCFGCGHDQHVRAVTRYRVDGSAYRRAVCTACNATRADWQIKENDKPRKGSLRKYVLATQPECSRCNYHFIRMNEGEVHHIVPISKGGLDVMQNLERLCDTCHLAAHGKRRRAK